jgi:hypothetical protein
VQKIPADLKGGNPVATKHFTFIKMKNRPVYFAYKHKAMPIQHHAGSQQTQGR